MSEAGALEGQCSGNLLDEVQGGPLAGKWGALMARAPALKDLLTQLGCASAGPNLAPPSRAASMCSKGSTEMMLAEGFLEQPVYDVESGIQPLITPSGIGAEMR